MQFHSIINYDSSSQLFISERSRFPLSFPSFALLNSPVRFLGVRGHTLSATPSYSRTDDLWVVAWSGATSASAAIEVVAHFLFVYFTLCLFFNLAVHRINAPDIATSPKRKRASQILWQIVAAVCLPNSIAKRAFDASASIVVATVRHRRHRTSPSPPLPPYIAFASVLSYVAIALRCRP
ncbi:uncharacterized protein G2W53_043063 [Senna tora]|uniref:Uncharacterized protein n=1 Tax=Senna tora TaxID=362788 RepID=A0A834SI27_9FABA|nr:uncharacterized protein G2W53_043063 [Senna tora]